MWLSGAGGDVPIDGAHVVAGVVLAHLDKLHAPALEDGVVFTGETVVDELPSRDLDTPDFGDEVVG